MFQVSPLIPELTVVYVRQVLREEKVAISEDGLEALVILSSGAMRRALHVLEGTNMVLGRGIGQNVYVCMEQHLNCDFANIQDWILNQDLITAPRNITQL